MDPCIQVRRQVQQDDILNITATTLEQALIDDSTIADLFTKEQLELLLFPDQWSRIMSFTDDLPRLIDKCPFDQLNEDGWTSILMAFPKLIDKCHTFDDFSSDSKYWIIKEQPSLYKHCKATDFTPHQWVGIIITYPKLGKYADWSTFEGDNLFEILINYPEMINVSDNLNTLNGDHWTVLISHFPHLFLLCDFETLTQRQWSWIVQSTMIPNDWLNTILAIRYEIEEGRMLGKY